MSEASSEWRSAISAQPKKKFFDERPLSEVPIKSPTRNMTDDEWRDLVEHWKDPRNMVSLFLDIEVVVFYMHMFSVY